MALIAQDWSMLAALESRCADTIRTQLTKKERWRPACHAGKWIKYARDKRRKQEAYKGIARV
ncbi:MAG: hypothetical protein J6P74_02730 [Paludibacteraceae bacterium]|nr:hypothetical protein [Paludibacteraceae bacterium]